MAIRVWSFDDDTPANKGFTGSTGHGTTARTGLRSLSLSTLQALSPMLGNSQDNYIGFGYRVTALIAQRILSIEDNGTQQVTVTRESDGSLAIRRGGSTGTILAQSAPGVLSVTNAWFHLQLRAFIDPANGAVELRVNSVTVASASSVNTRNGSNSFANQFSFVAPSGAGTCLVDDLWYSDSAFQGDCAVRCLFPNADGATNQWTAVGAANRFQCVDENPTPNEDTDYVSSSGVNDLQLFDFESLPETVGTVKAVQFNHRTRKDDAGARGVKPVIRSNSTNFELAEDALTTSYVGYQDMTTLDPTDSQPWTIARVNAVQFGLKVSS